MRCKCGVSFSEQGLEGNLKAQNKSISMKSGEENLCNLRVFLIASAL